MRRSAKNSKIRASKGMKIRVEGPAPVPEWALRYTDGHEMAIANWKNQTIWTGDNLPIMRA